MNGEGLIYIYDLCFMLFGLYNATAPDVNSSSFLPKSISLIRLGLISTITTWILTFLLQSKRIERGKKGGKRRKKEGGREGEKVK